MDFSLFQKKIKAITVFPKHSRELELITSNYRYYVMSSISLQSGFAKLHASHSFMTYMSLQLRVFVPYVPLCRMYLRGLRSLLKNLIYLSWASYLCVLIFFKFPFLEDYSRYYKPFCFYVGKKSAIKHFNP